MGKTGAFPLELLNQPTYISMDFPIVNLLDDELSEHWLLKHFHPIGLNCPHCGAKAKQARQFRRTRRSQVTVYRCRGCDGLLTLYSGTLFEAKHLRPSQVVLLLRGICKGEPTAALARELSLARATVHGLCQQLQQNAQRLQPETSVPDGVAETDEMFQNAGEKSERHANPLDPPRRRANKQRGHGTYQNDRPPIVGTVGRTSGQVRLRVVKRTNGATLKQHVERFTRPRSHVYTDEWRCCW